MRPRLAFALACLATSMLGCWQQSSDAPSGEELVTTLEPVASSPAPLSYNDDIALVTEDLACVINSFEFQVHCGERSAQSWACLAVRETDRANSDRWHAWSVARMELSQSST